jgi:hypothetical protein
VGHFWTVLDDFFPKRLVTLVRRHPPTTHSQKHFAFVKKNPPPSLFSRSKTNDVNFLSQIEKIKKGIKIVEPGNSANRPSKTGRDKSKSKSVKNRSAAQWVPSKIASFPFASSVAPSRADSINVCNVLIKVFKFLMGRKLIKVFKFLMGRKPD